MVRKSVITRISNELNDLKKKISKESEISEVKATRVIAEEFNRRKRMSKSKLKEGIEF